MKQLAEIATYGDLHRFLRVRYMELGLSREAIEVIADTHGGYASKVLSAIPVKRLGAQSLFQFLRAAAARVVLFEDDNLLAEIECYRKAKLTKNGFNGAMLADGKHGDTRGMRNVPLHRAAQRKIVRDSLRRSARKLAKQGGDARAASLTAAQRKRIAKRAAKARWHPTKEATNETA